MLRFEIFLNLTIQVNKIFQYYPYGVNSFKCNNVSSIPIRKIWEHFLAVCDYNKSLHGISWESLKEQLNQAELAKSWTLNPHAPEFVPNQPYSLHAQQQDHGYVYVGQSGAWPGQRLFPGRPLPQVCINLFHNLLSKISWTNLDLPALRQSVLRHMVQFKQKKNSSRLNSCSAYTKKTPKNKPILNKI